MDMKIGRREFFEVSAGAAAWLFGRPLAAATFPHVPGDILPLGVITYSFASMPLKPFAVAEYARQAGLRTVELKIEHLQLDAGAPGGGKRINKFDKDLRAKYDDWFKTVTLDTYKELRKKYDDLGMGVHILKVAIGEKTCREGGTADFWCDVAHALGADEITMEMPGPKQWPKVGPFFAKLTEKHGIKVGFHNHLQLKPDTYAGADSIFQYSKDIGLCFDIGHFVASNGRDEAIPFVKRHHDRIFSYHIKDRKSLAPKTPAVPFGEGDVPFKELFALVKKEGWIVPGDIELEYSYDRKTTDAAKEVAKCAAHCRKLFAEVLNPAAS